jgi:hypothetical protein
LEGGGGSSGCYLGLVHISTVESRVKVKVKVKATAKVKSNDGEQEAGRRGGDKTHFAGLDRKRTRSC